MLQGGVECEKRDVMREDEQGYVFVVGLVQEMVKRGSENKDAARAKAHRCPWSVAGDGETWRTKKESSVWAETFLLRTKRGLFQVKRRGNIRVERWKKQLVIRAKPQKKRWEAIGVEQWRKIRV